MRRFIFILAVIPVLASCLGFAPNPEPYAKEIIFWDESIPKEQCVGLFIRPGLMITSYNGVSVNWKENTMVFLPAGTVTFTMDAFYSGFSGKNLPFEWTFKPGELRSLLGWYRDDDPVILIIDGANKVGPDKQPAYKIPLRQGPLILQ